MLQIFKFDLGTLESLLRTSATVQIPETFKVLKSELMGDNYNVFVWILADWEAPKSETKFQAFGTGWDIPVDFADGHIETFIVPDEDTTMTYVWHLFGYKPE